MHSDLKDFKLMDFKSNSHLENKTMMESLYNFLFTDRAKQNKANKKDKRDLFIPANKMKIVKELLKKYF